MRRGLRWLAGLLLLGVAVVGCESDPVASTDGRATFRVLLTDAPADYIESAWVDIGAVELIPAGGGGPITLTTDGTDGFVDLFTLSDAATQQLASREIEAGRYTQLRLIVEAARVRLIDGYEFNDGTVEKELKVPSGAQTGIKINLKAAHGGEGEGLHVEPGETVVVLDFDVSQSFVIQGNPETPAGINGVIFKPTLRAAVLDVAGSIEGEVVDEDGVGFADVLVRAERLDPVTLESDQSQIATAITDAEGRYTLHFLVPGQYEVRVDEAEDLITDPVSHTVEVEDAEDVRGVDFIVIEEAVPL